MPDDIVTPGDIGIDMGGNLNQDQKHKEELINKLIEKNLKRYQEHGNSGETPRPLESGPTCGCGCTM